MGDCKSRVNIETWLSTKVAPYTPPSEVVNMSYFKYVNYILEKQGNPIRQNCLEQQVKFRSNWYQGNMLS